MSREGKEEQMTEQRQPAETRRDPRERYEPPAIIYRGKLEVYAVSCTKAVAGCVTQNVS
jgi:hypothetical protein